MSNKIPTREEIPQEYTWNTADLFPSDEAWEAELEAVRAESRKISDYVGRLGENGEIVSSEKEAE